VSLHLYPAASDVVAESSRHRHLRYCGSRTRRRPRSCRACNAAKIKCSFATPCSRCNKNDISCVYDRPGTGARRELASSVEAAHKLDLRPGAPPSTSLAPWALDANEDFLFNANLDLADHLIMDDAQLELASGNHHPSLHLSTQTILFNEPLILDGLPMFENHTSGQLQGLSDSLEAPYGVKDQQLASWCTWTRRGVSLAVVTENPAVDLDPSLLAGIKTQLPHAQHNANLVIQSLRSFPTMMLRRDTFPWFIHPHSQLFSKPSRDVLPRALSTCMSIAQMFASRTPETKSFLWSTIKTEYRRFLVEVRNFPSQCSSHLTTKRNTICPYMTSFPQRKLAWST
jgi:hypothetical protein